MRYILFITSLVALFASTASAGKSKPLNQKSFKEIIDSYFFVADFDRKVPERDISSYLFWRYPYKIGKGSFDIDFSFKDIENEIPVTIGKGEPYHHLNAGRVAFYKGEYEKARDIWVEGRKKYTTKYEHHRRMDYFIALSFLKIAQDKADASPKGYKDEEARAYFNNAATFLAWSLFKKEEFKDPLFSKITAKQSYNLAAIYYRYGRFGASYGAAKRGLDFIRKNGQRKFHTKLTRILAESFIQNRSYLDAIQSYDQTLRQSPSQLDAAAIFARVGDIYFDLNNYEVAILNYEIADKIYRDNGIVDVKSLIFMAESYFWKGESKKSNSLFRYALNYAHSSKAKSLISTETEAYARMRLADTYLSLSDFDRAKSHYLEISRDFRKIDAGKSAKIRSACLELPFYDGHNVSHARSTLENMKSENVSPQARELAWACEVASYAQRERSVAMIDRVKDFHKKYPRSRFLQSLVKPVEAVRKNKLYDLIKEDKKHAALAYYKTHRKLLFQKIEPKTLVNLFRMSVDVADNSVSDLLYSQLPKKKMMSDTDAVRKIVYLEERKQRLPKSSSKELKKYALKLNKRKWTQNRGVNLKALVHRALIAESPSKHTIWAYNLVQQWKVDSSSVTCTEQLPLMTTLAQDPKSSKNIQKQLRNKISSLALKLLPEMLKTDELCAIGLLNLETYVMRSQPKQLTDRYLSRLNWPMGEEMASVFWTVSEIAKNANLKVKAETLWKTIKSRAPKNSPKVAFAQQRLDKRTTEFERLWK